MWRKKTLYIQNVMQIPRQGNWSREALQGAVAHPRQPPPQTGRASIQAALGLQLPMTPHFNLSLIFWMRWGPCLVVLGACSWHQEPEGMTGANPGEPCTRRNPSPVSVSPLGSGAVQKNRVLATSWLSGRRACLLLVYFSNRPNKFVKRVFLLRLNSCGTQKPAS